jgi:XXXCH domain-containing protein
MLSPQKMERLFSPLEAAAFLRALADKLDQGRLEFGDVAVELDNSFTIKQSVKAKSDKVCFKLKLKYEKPLFNAKPGESSSPLADLDDDDDDEAMDPQQRPSYKHLKKAMGQVFKRLGADLAEGKAPDLTLAKPLWAHCHLMTTYPGRGEEHYPEFITAADELLAAAQAGQVPAMTEAMARLAGLKKSCHAQYK